MRSRDLGREGEIAAQEFLKRSGYRILATNYRCRFGEIDIVSERDGTVVFVEVKARSSDRFGQPAEAVTRSKQVRLYRLAQEFLLRHNLEDVPVRFDVLTLVRLGGDMEIEHLEGAF
ncbi:MAG: YraN family protein [candidate division WOR-3 bacterium]